MASSLSFPPGGLRYLSVDGLRIRYARSSERVPKSDHTILLLSPWPESLFAFLPTWQRLEQETGAQLVAVDLPGFGGSEGRADVLAPEAMGEFILRFMAALNILRPHAIGPDVGTSALLFAEANHPGSFRSVIIGSGATDASLTLGVLKEMVEADSIEHFRAVAPEAFVRGCLANLHNYQLPHGALMDYIQSYDGDRYVESIRYVQDYRSSLPRLHGRLASVTMPVLIIAGKHDPFVPSADAEKLCAALPHARLFLLDCGHFTWEDEAQAYAEMAVRWINQHKIAEQAKTDSRELTETEVV